MAGTTVLAEVATMLPDYIIVIYWRKFRPGCSSWPIGICENDGRYYVC